MKKTLILGIIIIVLLISFTGCDKENGDNNIKSPDNGMVAIIIQNFTSSGLSFVIENNTEYEYTYGSFYTLYTRKDDIWEAVEPIIENWEFDNILYELASNTKTELFIVDWLWLYGEIPQGDYRFQKAIYFVQSPTNTTLNRLILEENFFIP